MTIDLDSFVSVPLPMTLITALLQRSPHGVSSLIEAVVTDFLDRTGGDLSFPTKPVGIYWESLFLPNGTQVRTTYFDEVKLASVDNQAIIWDEKMFSSFAKLSNAMRGGKMTNAWRELQIKRPLDKTWMPAQALRR